MEHGFICNKCNNHLSTQTWYGENGQLEEFLVSCDNCKIYYSWSYGVFEINTLDKYYSWFGDSDIMVDKEAEEYLKEILTPVELE